MPLYEYICQDCKEFFEKLVSKSEQAVDCPKCGSRKAQMQLSVFRARTGSRSNTGFEPSGGGCGCTPSSCGCR